MTYSSMRHQLPQRLLVSSPVDNVSLIIKGQGVILFDACKPCCLTFCDSSGSVALKVRFTENAVLATMEPSDEPLIDTHNSKGIITSPGAYYWVSLDAQNQLLQAGIGEARQETLIYSYKLHATSKKFLESLATVAVKDLRITALLRDPITGSVPLLVKHTDNLTMHTIALGAHMPSTNLSATSQRLYNCISGKQFTLNTPDFPDFTKAIEYSIATPGKWCHECLKQKANEFSKEKPNYDETYLRITLGSNNGESPGIPYVMEIWPSGHFSPIHNHGGSSAIIRVLHGAIQVSLFPYLGDKDVASFARATFQTGDITWISPTLNQVHQLKNLDTKTTCITIQCYMYEQQDTTHYDYFDYLDENFNTQQFEPNSDMDFIDFKKQIQKEWLEMKQGRHWGWFCRV
jgi:predicted metal-dependent enzyme (double-stranded beta helix superfamily)